MKKATLILVTFLLAIFARDESNMPLSTQASLKENYSSAEMTIQATGMGRRDRDAVDDLYKSAVYFVLYNGTDPILNTDSEKLNFERIKESFFELPNINGYITWEADRVITSMRADLPDGRRGQGYKITKMVRVNRQKLIDDLVQQQIIVSHSELSADIGLPFIMVIPETPRGQTPLEVFDANPLAQQAAAVIESYLTARTYDVVVPRASEQLNDLATLQSELDGAQEDVSYQLALSLGADIYITFSGEVENNKASVVVKAFETTTARLLGTETGYSENRPGASEQALVEEALNGAINNVLSRVTQYWADDAERGLQYKIIFKVLDDFDADELEDIQFEIEDLMIDMFSESKENIITDETMDYLVWATQEEYNRSSRIYRALKSMMEDYANITRISINRKFILLGIEQPEF